MRALEAFDEAFLARDAGVMVGHIGSMELFDAAGATGALTVEDLRELIETRLDDLPLLRRRVEPDPSRPGRHRWTEGDAVEVVAHVHGHRLAGGDDRALGRFAAELNAPPLDRSRPLWEMHVIDGLEGDRVAVFFKIHHALGDAVPIRLVLDTVFGVGEAPPPPSRGRYDTTRPQPAANALPATAQVTARAMRFNRPLSGERDFAFAAFARERVERIRSESATTFTAVLLAAWAGALRGWLAMRGEAPSVPLVARIPVSLRRPGDDAASGNHLAAMAVAAPADQGDARARLRSAHEAMTRAKQALGSGASAGVAGGGGVNFALSPFIGSNRELAWRGAAGIGLFSLPMVNVAGLTIACGTYTDALRVGVHVDAEQVTDPWSLLRAFDLALAELESLAAG
jgi:hypothetical protein